VSGRAVSTMTLQTEQAELSIGFRIVRVVPRMSFVVKTTAHRRPPLCCLASVSVPACVCFLPPASGDSTRRKIEEKIRDNFSCKESPATANYGGETRIRLSSVYGGSAWCTAEKLLHNT